MLIEAVFKNKTSAVFGIAHTVLLCVVLVGFVSKDPKWHWTYQETSLTIDEYHRNHHHPRENWENGYFVSVVNSSIGESQCNNIPEVRGGGGSFWMKEPEPIDYGLKMGASDMCRFAHVTPLLERGSDPRGMVVFSSITSRTLFLAVQVAMASHALWQWSPFKRVSISNSDRGQQSSDPYKWWITKKPFDFIVTWGILLVLCVFCFVRQEQNLIVYNNILVVWLFCFFTGWLELLWSWRSLDSGGNMDKNSIVDVEVAVQKFMKTTAPLKSTPHGVAGGMNMAGFMPFTNIPAIPSDGQGNVRGTWNTVEKYPQKLDDEKLTPVSRWMLLGNMVPIFLAASLVESNNYWAYNDVLFFALAGYTLFALYPAFYMTMLLLRSETDNDSNGEGGGGGLTNNKKGGVASQYVHHAVSSGWMVVVLLLLVCMIFGVVFFSLFVSYTQSKWTSTTLSVLSVIFLLVSSIAFIVLGLVCMAFEKMSFFSYATEIISACISVLCVVGVFS